MMGYGVLGLGGLWMVAFWVFVVVGIVWLVLTASGRAQRADGDSSGGALRILEERLARGEIDAEEFRTRRAALEGSK